MWKAASGEAFQAASREASKAASGAAFQAGFSAESDAAYPTDITIHSGLTRVTRG